MIRKAQPSDANGLQECMALAYSIYTERMQGKALPPMDIDYSQEIEQYPTWVIECDGVIAGGIILVLDSSSLSIANISVHPDYQGRGFGSKLLNFAQTIAKKHNYSQMRLATHVLLVENIALYTHLGWSEYDRDDIRVYMSKGV
jgi:GNAT superfamily N-acetyltransferase